MSPTQISEFTQVLGTVIALPVLGVILYFAKNKLLAATITLVISAVVIATCLLLT